MHLFYRFIILSCQGVASVFYRWKVYGKEHAYDRSAIIASNHASYLDPPLLAISWPHEIHFLATDYLFRVPFLGWLIRKVNSHPITRGKADIASMKLVVQLLRDGKQVLIFPEGRRSEDGHLSEIKQGIPMIAVRAKCAIVPAYISGAFEAWGRSSRYPKLFKKIDVVFGSPILPSEYESLNTKDAQTLILSRLEESIKGLKAWLEAGAKGTPP